MKLTTTQQHELLQLARESIEHGLRERRRVEFPQRTLDEDLLQPRSAFVTLRIHGELRGCCGSIDAPRPLAHDIWHNAWASAFCDPRFAPLRSEEWPNVRLHVSILTPSEPLSVRDERDLLAQLRPHVDGLILEGGGMRATFLPAVWDQLPDPRDFVRELKRKAGWPADHWSADIQALRYGTESFGEH